MINNFSLAAIIREDEDKLNIVAPEPLSDSHKKLSAIWSEQYEKFLEKRPRIYMPDSKLTTSEYFVLEPYTLPDWLGEYNIETENTRRLEKRFDIDSNSIVAFVGFGRKDSEEIITFQNFTTQQIIKPNSIISLYRGYEHIDNPNLLVIGKSLTAIYYPSEKKLLFRAFKFTNRFLELEEVYHENSKRIINNILEHNIFDCDDMLKDSIARECDNKVRKNFHKLEEAGILDRISIEKLQREFSNIGFDIEIRDEKIVVPRNYNSVNESLIVLNGDIKKRSIFKDSEEELFIVKDKAKYNLQR
jgi:hypothetical protein